MSGKRERYLRVLTGPMLLALAACGGAKADSGVHPAAEDPTCAQPARPVPPGTGEPGQSAASVGVIRTSRDVETALRATMRGLDADRFSKVRVGDPPADPPVPPGLWLYAAAVAPTMRHDLTGEWEAELAAGAVADRCAGANTDLHQVMEGVTFHTAGTGHGRGGFGDVRAGQVFGAEASGDSDEAIVARIEAVLTSYGLTPRKVRVLRPLGPAVHVVATLADVDVLADRMHDLDTALAGRHGHELYEGVYLAIDKTDGTPLLRSYDAGRASAGGVWFAPGLDSLWGINHL